jgi:hypothetical protein
MNFRERILNIYQHKPVDNIVWQPRLDYLFNRSKELGTLPKRYRDMELLDFYDDLNCSIRPYGYYGQCFERIDPPGVKYETIMLGGENVPTEYSDASGDLFQARQQFTKAVFGSGSARIERVKTPIGVLETHISYTDLSWHTSKYPVQNPDDVRIMKYILKGTTYRFNPERFREVEVMIGDRSAPMMYLLRTNIMRLIVEFMGFEKTIFALHEEPEMMEDFIDTINATDESLISAIEQSPIPIVTFDDNLHCDISSPNLFKRYMLPVYQQRIMRFHAAGKVCHSHWDGHCKPLLPYAHETGLDGIEAITPQPQGDVTIDEIKAGLGEDIILLDGIPMTSFLPYAPEEELVRITRQVIETFAPNLILGISDEPSPDCLIDRIRLVSEIVNEYDGKIMDLAEKRRADASRRMK